MLFKTVYKKEDKILVKIALDDGKEVWATTSEAVYNWAKKNFKDGDEINAEYTTKNGQYFVNRITTGGSGSKKTITPKKTTSDSLYTCEDCGASLKDGKYKKCYTCNKKNPSKSSSKSGSHDYKNGAPYGSLLHIEATRRNKLAVFSSICTAVTALAGQIDPNSLGDYLIENFEKAYKKLFG